MKNRQYHLRTVALTVMAMLCAGAPAARSQAGRQSPQAAAPSAENTAGLPAAQENGALAAQQDAAARFDAIAAETPSTSPQDSLRLLAPRTSLPDSLRDDDLSVKLFLDKIEVEGKLEKPQAIFIIPGSDPEIDDYSDSAFFL